MKSSSANPATAGFPLIMLDDPELLGCCAPSTQAMLDDPELPTCCAPSTQAMLDDPKLPTCCAPSTQAMLDDPKLPTCCGSRHLGSSRAVQSLIRPTCRSKVGIIKLIIKLLVNFANG